MEEYDYGKIYFWASSGIFIIWGIIFLFLLVLDIMNIFMMLALGLLLISVIYIAYGIYYL